MLYCPKVPEQPQPPSRKRPVCSPAAAEPQEAGFSLDVTGPPGSHSGTGVYTGMPPVPAPAMPQAPPPPASILGSKPKAMSQGQAQTQAVSAMEPAAATSPAAPPPAVRPRPSSAPRVSPSVWLGQNIRGTAGMTMAANQMAEAEAAIAAMEADDSGTPPPPPSSGLPPIQSGPPQPPIGPRPRPQPPSVTDARRPPPELELSRSAPASPWRPLEAARPAWADASVADADDDDAWGEWQARAVDDPSAAMGQVDDQSAAMVDVSDADGGPPQPVSPVTPVTPVTAEPAQPATPEPAQPVTPPGARITPAMTGGSHIGEWLAPDFEDPPRGIALRGNAGPQKEYRQSQDGTSVLCRPCRSWREGYGHGHRLFLGGLQPPRGTVTKTEVTRWLKRSGGGSKERPAIEYPGVTAKTLAKSCLRYVHSWLSLCDVVCVHLLRYVDVNVMYSHLATSGNGAAWITFEDSPRGYFMCWYARDRLLEWYREFQPNENTGLASGATGHAPDAGRTWYYYKVCFVNRSGHAGSAMGTGHFGIPLIDTDRFPGWDTVSKQYSAIRGRYLAALAAGNEYRSWILL